MILADALVAACERIVKQRMPLNYARSSRPTSVRTTDFSDAGKLRNCPVAASIKRIPLVERIFGLSDLTQGLHQFGETVAYRLAREPHVSSGFEGR